MKEKELDGDEISIVKHNIPGPGVEFSGDQITTMICQFTSFWSIFVLDKSAQACRIAVTERVNNGWSTIDGVPLVDDVSDTPIR